MILYVCSAISKHRFRKSAKMDRKLEFKLGLLIYYLSSFSRTRSIDSLGLWSFRVFSYNGNVFDDTQRLAFSRSFVLFCSQKRTATCSMVQCNFRGFYMILPIFWCLFVWPKVNRSTVFDQQNIVDWQQYHRRSHCHHHNSTRIAKISTRYSHNNSTKKKSEAKRCENRTK